MPNKAGTRRERYGMGSPSGAPRPFLLPLCTLPRRETVRIASEASMASPYGLPRRLISAPSLAIAAKFTLAAVARTPFRTVSRGAFCEVRTGVGSLASFSCRRRAGDRHPRASQTATEEIRADRTGTGVRADRLQRAGHRRRHRRLLAGSAADQRRAARLRQRHADLRAGLRAVLRGGPPGRPVAGGARVNRWRADLRRYQHCHAFFRNPRGTEIRNSAGLLGPGLDVRVEGGYVVVPPSRTLDPYEWVDSSPLAEASWLIERLTERDEATLF